MTERMRGVYESEDMLSVLVSSFNQLGTLKLAFESYSVQEGVPFEVIVADDGSTDGTLEWLPFCAARFPTRIVSVKHSGYGLVRAWNEAAKTAKGARLLFTNADVVHAAGSFAAHGRVECVGAGLVAGIAMTAAKMVTAEDARDGRRMAGIRVGGWASGNLDFAKEVHLARNWVGAWSSNLSVPRDAFLETWGFDDRYAGKWGCEDYDLVGRLADAGCPAEWVHGSMAWHLGHAEADYAKAAEGCRRYAGC